MGFEAGDGELVVSRNREGPAIIPGVHHHCDDWCDYCAVTARCLAFRCTAVFRNEHGRADGQLRIPPIVISPSTPS